MILKKIKLAPWNFTRRCERCGGEWESIGKSTCCGKCKSPYWNNTRAPDEKPYSHELNPLLAVASNDRLLFTALFNHGLLMSEVITLTDPNVVDGYLVVQRPKIKEDDTASFGGRADAAQQEEQVLHDVAHDSVAQETALRKTHEHP